MFYLFLYNLCFNKRKYLFIIEQLLFDEKLIMISKIHLRIVANLNSLLWMYENPHKIESQTLNQWRSSSVVQNSEN